MPLSQAEVGELSEGVRADQKKLMEAAPTEWNSGLGRTAKEAALAAAAAAAKKKRGRRRHGSVGGEGEGGDEEEDDETGLVDPFGDDGSGGRPGAAGVGVVDDDSSLGLLYRLLLAEMQGNGPSGGLNNRWIDSDALLQVGFDPVRPCLRLRLCLCLRLRLRLPPSE